MARILIVEDEASIRQVFQVVLEDAGYVVVEASNGAAGLQRYAAAPADLVILDMQMPVMDGTQVILALRGKFPNTTISCRLRRPRVARKGARVPCPGHTAKTVCRRRPPRCGAEAAVAA